MPFYNYNIGDPKTDINEETFDGSNKKIEFDEGAFANLRMVNAMRHLSQLIKIADDIFSAIETECRIIFVRTNRLNIKLQRCQEIVDNLNAKNIKVPLSSLSGKPLTIQPYKSCDVEKIVNDSIFSSFPRPPAVDLLRNLAHGPSPPVIIPCNMVAPEADEFTGTIPNSNTSTHIYCKPVKVKDICKPTCLDSGDIDDQSKNMTSTVEVPSTVVPIDVSGQPFSRMASFRRSLIHVDFLIRRKRKKDKRRNTVTEGDVKDLKDALQNIVNEECQKTIPNTISSYQQIIADSKKTYNSKVQEAESDKIDVEQNNNSANLKFNKTSNCMNILENKNSMQERSKHCILTRQSQKCFDVKINEQENILMQVPGKRKPKSHIPISTISAAMNVAVEMRQCNGVEKQRSISNSVSSNMRNLDPEGMPLENRRISDSSLFTDDDASQESWKSYKKRLQDKCRSLAHKRNSSGNDSSKDTEASSSASSESIAPQEKTVVGTSTESDSYFISSDESDIDSADLTYLEQTRGSLTSLGTISDGSLNSLLSETGTEMTSSTGTLTSVGREHVLTPPPPPPPMILSATAKDSNIITQVRESSYIGYNLDATQGQKSNKAENVHKKTKKQLKSPKVLKPQKSSLFDVPGNSTENSKNIFSSLVGLKTNTKEKNKSKKEEEKKKSFKMVHQPVFDMYGHNSPKKVKQVSSFVKENISPVIESGEKSHLKSFSVNDVKKSDQPIDANISGKSTSTNIPSINSSNINHAQLADFSKRNGNPTINHIPTKYEHQVTVTPVQRNTDKENKTMHHVTTSAKESQMNENGLKRDSALRSGHISSESQLSAPRAQRPQPPNSLQHERSKAARVVLDFDGKVIYSTNSLDRKHYSQSPTVNMYNSVQNKFSESCFKGPQPYLENSYYNTCQESYMPNSGNYARPEYTSSIVYSHTPKVYASMSDQTSPNVMQTRSGNKSFFNKELCPLNQTGERGMISHSQYPQYCISENMQSVVPKRITSRPNSFAGTSSNIYLRSSPNQFLPDPNVSGLPVQDTMLTKHNVNLHSKHMERINTYSSEDSFNTPSNSFYPSPSSEKSCGNIFNKSPQSTISTEDLFAVIHNCKKRMNIKTDSDISLASSSSRSSSPSYVRSSSSKGTLAETGFLSPRNQIHLETSGDRRSWADFRPIDSICNERKSLASDRLGPTKPTSMHDFKMLLLQARSSSQISGPRKSAVEMLKVPQSQNSQDSLKSLALNLSPRNSLSVPNSPSTELSLYNGHSTVPFKRGNRVRTSLQSRYTMYPPIFEDCSEDLENCNEPQTNKLADVSTIKNSKDRNVEWNHTHNTNSHNMKMQAYSCDSENNFQPS